MTPLEIEVKFYLNTTEPIRRFLTEQRAASQGRFFETNIRFEDTNNGLKKNKSLLRLRQDKKASLTYKSKAPDADKDFKIHRELEVDVSDFNTMYRILESLGFHQEQIYEKWRETFVIGRTNICIDQMPYGEFLEIEGEKEAIKQLADAANLNWDDRILMNYLEMFDIIKRKLNLDFKDITFDNFKNIPEDASKFHKLFTENDTA